MALTDNDRIEAIVARDWGMPYSKVLSVFEITAGQFYLAAARNLETLIHRASHVHQQVLKAIKDDPNRLIQLFRMEEEYLKEQYDKVMGIGSQIMQTSFFVGTYIHPENIEDIIYYALTRTNGLAKSRKREEVIEAISGLPTNLSEYLRDVGLGSLMVNAFEKGTALLVIKSFDEAYIRRTGDRSLFDPSEKVHLHEWDIGGSAPQGYWKDRENAAHAIDHILTENYPKLNSNSRQEIIETIQSMPNDLAAHFTKLGLCKVMDAFPGKERSSPLAVLKRYDEARIQKTADASLFDLNEQYHLHEWDIGGSAPQGYCKNRSNTINAVYHVLSENYPGLGSPNRGEVVRSVDSLPTNIQKAMQELGLAGMMGNAFPKGETDSIVGLIRAFDEKYMLVTKDASLFDPTKAPHLEIYRVHIHRVRAVF